MLPILPPVTKPAGPDAPLPAERLAPVVAPPAFLRRACHYIERHCTEALRMSAVAAHVNVSASTLRRGFARALGVSPQQFYDACRTERLKDALRRGPSVTDAIFAAGFESASRVYEGSDDKLGMTPGQYQRLGEGLDVSYLVEDTSLGKMMIAATHRGICFLHFGDDEAQLRRRLDEAFAAARSIVPAAPGEARSGLERRQLAAWRDAVRAFVDDMAPMPDMPVHLLGTAYQRRVWTFLQTVPAGTTLSYGAAAQEMGHRDGARALAQACAKNNVAIVVPCHRIIRGDGTAGGYRFGAERKRKLLLREKLTPKR